MNVGVAAHITAASPGGSRYDAKLTPQERRSIGNAIWLCQNCAKLVDNDPTRFTEGVLREWKRRAEERASAAVGKTRQGGSAASDSERQVKRDLALKKRMRRDFLKPAYGLSKAPCDKFARSEVIIHSVDDRSYRNVVDTPGTSGWFKVEVWDFYHNGLEVLLLPERGIIREDGSWAVIPYGTKVDETKHHLETVLRVGRIPWRNIIDYDLGGDEYYNVPHVYCRFADNGQPYEDIVYYLDRGEFFWPLQVADCFQNVPQP